MDERFCDSRGGEHDEPGTGRQRGCEPGRGRRRSVSRRPSAAPPTSSWTTARAGELDADAPLGRARHGRGGARPVPGHEARDRAGHRRRLLLRLPAAAAADPRRPRRDRGADAREHRRRPPVRAERAVAGRGPRVLGRARPAVQGRDHRRPAGRRRARRHARCRRRRSTGTARSSTCAAARTSRAPARSGRSSCSARPARTGAATRSGRCSSASTARSGRPRKSSTQYLWRREEAKKRDHRRLGVQLDLFSFHDVSPGLGVLAPQGPDDLADARGRDARAPGAARLPGGQHADRRVASGCGASRATGTSTSENMFIVESEDQTFSLKPMNCPESTFIYRSHLRSYRDLPLRFSEFGRLHRNERSGTLSGLTRVRQFIQDDAHLYVRPDQLMDEIEALLGEVREAYGWFGLEPRFAFATKPDKALGDPALWERAEQLIREAFAAADITLRPQAQGRHVLRAQDRHLHRRRARARMADGDHPGRPRDAARAVRPDLHRRERPAAAPDRHPPRHLRLARAVHRHPRRALRRRLPVLGGAGPGRRHPDRRPPHRRGRRTGRRPARRAACGSRSTTRTTGCRTRSAWPRSRRCRTCSSSATARSRRGPSRRAPATRPAGSSRRRSPWDDLADRLAEEVAGANGLTGRA